MDTAHLPEVIIISGHGTIEAAVRATKLGAYDFLEKPLSLDRTLLVLRNAINARQLREDNQEFVRQLSFRASVTGNSVPMKALRQEIKLMAPTNGRAPLATSAKLIRTVFWQRAHFEFTSTRPPKLGLGPGSAMC